MKELVRLILIVDDQQGVRELFKENLQEQGYICLAASSGDEALEIMATQTVDLALIDIMMPGMNGLVLFQHVKELYPAVAVIFITAMNDADIAVEHLKNGGYDYIVKPVTRHRLQQAVEEALEKCTAMLEDKQNRRSLEQWIALRAEESQARMCEIDALDHVSQADLPQKQSRLWRTVIRSQESKKKRVSEYLHGHVQSKLLVLQHRLGQCQEMVALDPEKASASLDEIKAELRSIQEDDIRRSSHELYPSIVKIGLIPALRSLRDRFWKGIPVDLCIDAEVDSAEEYNQKSFPEELKVGVYRIVEEALENVVKHAHAQTTKIKLYYNGDGHLALDVDDDGCGFDINKVSRASGLPAINGYAEGLGGSCQFDSVPGHGTRVHVILPFPTRLTWQVAKSQHHDNVLVQQAA